MSTRLCANCGKELDKDLRCPQCGRIYSQTFSFNSNSFGDTSYGDSPFGAIPLEDTSTTFLNDEQHMFNQDTANIDQDRWNEWINQSIDINRGQHSPFNSGSNSTPEQNQKKRISGYTIAAVVLFCIIIVQVVILFMINRNRFKLTSSIIDPAYASTETRFLVEEALQKKAL